MFIRKKFTVTSDGHTMTLDRGSSGSSTTDDYEVDRFMEMRTLSSGRTKKEQATRRGLDNGKHRIKKMGRRYMKSMNSSCRTISIEEYNMRG